MDATLVLRCLSEPESEAGLRSVRISEIAQKLTEIATFFQRKNKDRLIVRLKERRKKRFKGKLCPGPGVSAVQQMCGGVSDGR